MKKWLLPLLVVFVVACKERKVNLSGDAPVKVNDFIAAFQPLNLPVTFEDTTLHKIGDTLTIGTKVLAQFIPDSVVDAVTGGLKKVSIHPVGRIDRKNDKEIYLLAKLDRPKKQQLVVFVLDRKNKFLATKHLLNSKNEDDYAYSVNINKEPTFLLGKEKISKETKMLVFTKVGWGFSGAEKAFSVIVNDSNESLQATTILNPLDTLPKKRIHSGDYMENEKNFISLRDGKDDKTYLFFVHFEKKNGSCTGELKGEMKMKDANTAVYTQSGDPCIIDFKFEDNEITMKEKGSCGNRRGIDCLFSDTFKKKKDKKEKKHAVKSTE